MSYDLSRLNRVTLLTFLFLSFKYGICFSYDFTYETTAPLIRSFSNEKWDEITKRVKLGGERVPEQFWRWIANQINQPENQPRIKGLFEQMTLVQQTSFIDTVVKTDNRTIADSVLGNQHALKLVNRLATDPDVKRRPVSAFAIATLATNIPPSLRASFQSDAGIKAIKELFKSSNDGFIQPVFEYLDKHPEDFTHKLFKEAFAPTLLNQVRINPQDRSAKAFGTPMTRPAQWVKEYLGRNPQLPTDPAFKADIYKSLSTGVSLQNRQDLYEAYKVIYPNDNTPRELNSNQLNWKKVESCILKGNESKEEFLSLVEKGENFWTPDLIKTLMIKMKVNSPDNYAWLLNRMNEADIANIPHVSSFLKSPQVVDFIIEGMRQNNGESIIFAAKHLNSEKYQSGFLQRLEQDHAGSFTKAMMDQFEGNPKVLADHSEVINIIVKNGLSSRIPGTRKEVLQGLTRFSLSNDPQVQKNASDIGVKAIVENPKVAGVEVLNMNKESQEFLQERILANAPATKISEILVSSNANGYQRKIIADYILKKPDLLEEVYFERYSYLVKSLLDMVKDNPDIIKDAVFKRVLFNRSVLSNSSSSDDIAEYMITSKEFREIAFPYLLSSNSDYFFESFISKSYRRNQYEALEDLHKYIKNNSIQLSQRQKEILEKHRERGILRAVKASSRRLHSTERDQESGEFHNELNCKEKLIFKLQF
jgi:hypothetical protein